MAKILVVDDDRDILKFVDALLTQAEHEVKIATDPIIALGLINHRTFDLIITDANMPHYTGFELVKTIRSHNRCKNVGIAMLTSLREKENIEKAIKAGVDDYIIKPIDPLIFLRKIKDLLDKKTPTRQNEIALSELFPESKSQVHLESQILSVAETHLKLRTPFPLPEGTLITLKSQLLNIMGFEPTPPPLKVIAIEKVENDYHLTVSFVGLRETDYEKIRNWINIETSKRKLKAI